MQDDLKRFSAKMHGVFNDPQKIEQEWGVRVLDSTQLTCLNDLGKKQGTKEKENSHTYKVDIHVWCENISFGRC